MSGNWDVLGGDPAPGLPDHVDATARAFLKLSAQADDARKSLVRAVSVANAEHWRGPAATAFRSEAEKLPDLLTKVAVSYSEAASALRGYSKVLSAAQFRARSLSVEAHDAAAEAQREEALADRAKERAAAASRGVHDAQARASSFRRQQAATLDPGMHGSLGAQATEADSARRRAQSDLNLANADQDRHHRAADAARDRLGRAISQAKSLFEDVARAADGASRLIEAAQDDAQLPGFTERIATEAKELLVTYGPVLVDTLQLGATLFSLAAAILPVGAPIFLAASLICGSAALLLNIGVTGASPEGFSTAKIIELSLQALGVAASVCGLGAITGAKWAFTAGKVIDAASDAGHLAKGAVEGGTEGFLAEAGCLVLGKVGAKAGDKMLAGVAGKVRSSPSVRAVLDGLSRSARNSAGDRLFGVTISTNAVRMEQSMLATIAGRATGPGRFQIGNTAHLAPSILDHAPSKELIDKAIKDVVSKPVDFAVDKATEGVRNAIAAAHAEEPTIHLPQDR